MDHRLAFINSAKDIVKHYAFDGLDLAWEFPETKPKKIRSSFSKFPLRHTKTLIKKIVRFRKLLRQPEAQDRRRIGDRRKGRGTQGTIHGPGQGTQELLQTRRSVVNPLRPAQRQ